MKLILDKDTGILTLEDKGLHQDIPLYSREAFELFEPRVGTRGLGGPALLYIQLAGTPRASTTRRSGSPAGSRGKPATGRHN